MDAYNILHLVADVGAVPNQVGVERAHVIGDDWGAAVAWKVPDAVNGLLIDFLPA